MRLIVLFSSRKPNLSTSFVGIALGSHYDALELKSEAVGDLLHRSKIWTYVSNHIGDI